MPNPLPLLMQRRGVLPIPGLIAPYPIGEEQTGDHTVYPCTGVHQRVLIDWIWNVKSVTFSVSATATINYEKWTDTGGGNFQWVEHSIVANIAIAEAIPWDTLTAALVAAGCVPPVHPVYAAAWHDRAMRAASDDGNLGFFMLASDNEDLPVDVPTIDTALLADTFPAYPHSPMTGLIPSLVLWAYQMDCGDDENGNPDPNGVTANFLLSSYDASTPHATGRAYIESIGDDGAQDLEALQPAIAAWFSSVYPNTYEYRDSQQTTPHITIADLAVDILVNERWDHSLPVVAANES